MVSERNPERVSVPRLLVVILLVRTVLNTAYRAVYPFLPFIATDLGVTLESAASIIQSRNLIGLTAPLFGPLSDRFGRRSIMVLGVGAAVIACLLLGGFATFTFAVIAISAMALGKALYDPAQQAYLGDRIPYHRRGRAMSLSETSWSAAALIGLPFMGFMVQFYGWRAGFFALGVFGLLGLVLTRLALPESDHKTSSIGSGIWGGTFARVLGDRRALAVLVTGVLNTASNENLNVTYGAWMKDSFLLDAIALGTVAAAIGVAELSAELFTSGLVDRVGKHRLVDLGLFASAIAYIALPWIGRNAVLATVALFILFFGFEISVVAALPLISEIVPGARGTLMSLNVAAFSLGRTLGSFVGPFVFLNGGFRTNMFVSAAISLLAFAVWHVLVNEGPRETMI